MPYFVDSLEGNQASVNSYPGKSLRIGRGTNADLRFDDASIALEHAVIEQDEAGWTIHDRGGGTFVGESRVDSRRLANGDQIDLGVFRLNVEILSTEDPLFLHVAKIGQESESSVGEVTLSTLKGSGGDLLAMVEMAEATRRMATMKEVAEPRVTAEPQAEDSFVTMAASLVVHEETAATPPPATPPPATPSPTRTPQAEKPATPRPPPGRAPRPIDYAHAYGLERRWLSKSLLTVFLALLTAGGLWALFKSGRQDVFSPGPLTSVHKAVTNNDCRACHSGWKPVAAQSCQSSSCHDAVGEHQTIQLRDPPCLECHTEHRDLQALRLLSEGGCVACHGSLRTRAGESQFNARITGFGTTEHPGFTPRTDPGALEFHHAWHLTKLKKRGKPALTCESCHLQNDDGEVDPVVFEEHCQECHNLTFDQRFGDEQAPHVSPTEVLTYLAGFYSLKPEVLGRLSSRERGRLRRGGRNLSQEQQLAEVARWNARALVRTQCTKCHRLNQNLETSKLEDTGVRPTRLRDRWLEHAAFSHTPHLELDMSCDDCHRTARASQKASDVLLPAIAGCRNCHRTPEAGESLDSTILGRIECTGCHTYHLRPGELATNEGI